MKRAGAFEVCSCPFMLHGKCFRHHVESCCKWIKTRECPCQTIWRRSATSTILYSCFQDNISVDECQSVSLNISLSWVLDDSETPNLHNRPPPGMDDCETLWLFNTFTFTIVQHSFHERLLASRKYSGEYISCDRTHLGTFMSIFCRHESTQVNMIAWNMLTWVLSLAPFAVTKVLKWARAIAWRREQTLY